MVREVLEGHTALGKSKKTRILIISLCLMLCGASLIDLEAKPEYKPVNEALDQIRLRSEGPIEVLHDVSIPRDRLYTIHPYKKWFDDKQIWVHVQGVIVNQTPVGVLYVEFRNDEDAQEGLKGRLSHDNGATILEGRRFGRFAIFVTRPSHTEEKTHQAIFSALAGRFEDWNSVSNSPLPVEGREGLPPSTP